MTEKPKVPPGTPATPATPAQSAADLQTELAKARQAVAESEQRVAAEQAKSAELEMKLAASRVDREIEATAQMMGFEYPDIAPSLIDRRRVSIDPDTGKVKGVREALEKMLAEMPGLSTAGRRGGSPPRQGTPPRLGPDRGTVRQPTPEEELIQLGGYV